MRLSPFGMATCCVCDEPTTHAIPTLSGELLPHCASCAKALKAEFPDATVLLYAPRLTSEVTR